MWSRKAQLTVELSPPAPMQWTGPGSCRLQQAIDMSRRRLRRCCCCYEAPWQLSPVISVWACALGFRFIVCYRMFVRFLRLFYNKNEALRSFAWRWRARCQVLLCWRRELRRTWRKWSEDRTNLCRCSSGSRISNNSRSSTVYTNSVDRIAHRRWGCLRFRPFAFMNSLIYAFCYNLAYISCKELWTSVPFVQFCFQFLFCCMLPDLVNRILSHLCQHPSRLDVQTVC